jgi:hypothetical protein
MRALLAGCALAGAVALAGCGGGGGGGGGMPDAAAKRVLDDANAKLNQSKSSRISFDIRLTSNSLNNPITIPGSGAFDYRTHAGWVKLKVGSLESFEAIVRGNIVWLKASTFSRAAGTTKPWVKFDSTKSSETAHFDPSTVRQIEQTDPSGALGYLRGATTIDDRGSVKIGGTETTRYHAEVDLDQVVPNTPAASRAGVSASVAQLKNLGISKLPIDVWIDRRGRPRRLVYAVTAEQQGVKATGATTIDLTDFGLKVRIPTPPADQVDDLTKGA